jgi:hypothetical protein
MQHPNLCAPVQLGRSAFTGLDADYGSRPFLLTLLIFLKLLAERHPEDQNRGYQAVDNNEYDCHCVTSETCQLWQVTIFTICRPILFVSDGGQEGR